MSWSPQDPGAGDPGGIRTMAQRRRTEAEELADDLVRIETDIDELHDAWVGAAGPAFVSAAGRSVTKIRRLVDVHQQTAAALDRYALAVEQIAAEATTLRGQVDANDRELVQLAHQREILAADPALAAQLATVEQRLRAAQIEQAQQQDAWGRIAARRTEADRACVADLAEATITPKRLSMLKLSAEELADMSDAEFMAWLSGLSPGMLVTMLKDAELGQRLAAVEDASLVAAWWQSLAEPVTPGEAPPDPPIGLQAALLAAIPAVLGNLNGIWYTHRDEANRTVFMAEYERLKEIEAAVAGLWSVSEQWAVLAEYGYDNPGLFAEHLAEAEAIKATLDREPVGDDPNPPFQFVLYVPGDPTFAAVSVGNLDTASQVTTNVPGMGTTVTKSLEEWTMSAENLYFEQVAMNAHYGTGETGFASVAWIGYEAPVMPWVNPFDVLSSADAKAGAPNLVDFLEGVTTTRDWQPGENLSVVAHSYGTTVASLALAETPVESFVMLGSAGIDSSIPTVADLQVDPANVWASEAEGDGIADVGRIGDHWVDPTGADYGANVFSSEERVLAGDELLASDGHESSPAVGAEIANKEPTAYGYLDSGTTPLRSSALITLGVTDPLVYYAGGGVGSGGGGGR